RLSGTIDDPNAILVVTVAQHGYVAVNNGDGTWTLPANMIYPGLTDGTYDVALAARDRAGNTGHDTSSNELVIDTVAPVVTVNSLLTNSSSPRLSGTIDDPNAILVVTVAQHGYVAVNN